MTNPVRQIHTHVTEVSIALLVTLVINIVSIAEVYAKSGAPTAILRSKIEVAGDVITLGDIFINAEEASDVVVSAAPHPGQRARLSPRHIASIAAANGLRWRNPARLERVIVSRTGQKVSRELLLEEISQALHDRGAPDLFDILFSDRHLALYIPTDIEASVEVTDLEFDARSGQFKAQVRAPAGVNDAPLTNLSGRIFAAMEVPTLTTSLQRGDVISSSHIEWTKVRLDRVGRSIVTQDKELIGKAAKRRLSAGKAIRISDVEAPVVIGKGALITIIYEASGMRLTAEGRALMDGGMGERIRVINTRSNQTVNAVIEGPSQVKVSPRKIQLSAYR